MRRVDCTQFSYAVMVAQRLKECLPKFSYLKIPKKPEEWDKWLIKICKENNWYHIKSPLIWREPVKKKAKKEFIGDINKFLDMCHDHYGIPKDILSAGRFNKKEMEWFIKRMEYNLDKSIKVEAVKRRTGRSRQVCITGAACLTAEVIIMELLQIEKQWREGGLEIRLFDHPSKVQKLTGSATDARYCPGPSGLGNCRVTSTLKEALNNVDLVIVLDSIFRKSKETVVKWLKRNRNAMCALGKALNKYAPSHCRVIIGSPSNQPICYNATVLASFATKLHVRNIVAVTQDLGREELRSFSNKTKVPLKDFFCPPVWGFVGLNKVIDYSNTLQCYVYKVPGKRMNTTLPQGTECLGLRTSRSFLTEDEKKEIQVRGVEAKEDVVKQPLKWSGLAKATAILDLLKVWGLKQENGGGEVISLGIYSDGTFNIPKGLYWSQPATLVNGFWMPFKEYPIPRSTFINGYYLFPYSMAALYRTKVQPRIYDDPPEVLASPKTIKKFDFDKLVQEIGIPVIRTDKECFDYLNHLAKKEFDLDETESTISEQMEEDEVVPTEEVKDEEIFCECWRQQLKELQKVVFDRASSTEVEIDLSEVISGSEWSVINPKNSSVSATTSATTTATKIEDEEREKLSSPRTENSNHTPVNSVCSCGLLESGSTCQCLGPEPKDAPKGATSIQFQDEISTEQFYAKQNAEVFEVSPQDAIYADSYPIEKHVSFDSEAKLDDLTGAQVKFYGRKDAIRDKEADERMRKRIRRYERGGEDSVEEESEAERGDVHTVDSMASGDTGGSQKDGKFHLSVQGASYEIIGDQNALESLDERRGSTEIRDSSFSEMYADKIIPSIKILPHDVGVSTTTSSGKDISISEEGNVNYGKGKEWPGEGMEDRISLSSLENDLNEVWGEDLFYGEMPELKGEGEEEEGEKEEEEEKKKKRKKKLREGVPLCCLCRCIIPEGLPCCPCGTKTVIEVVKKESVEIFIQSEDDISYNVEYLESVDHFESPVAEIKVKPRIREKILPPESFFPFTPKLKNVFTPVSRPYELTKQYMESFKKVELQIPPKCAELLDEARAELERKEVHGEIEEEEEEEEEDEDEEKVKGESTEGLPSCADEEAIKTDFSDLKLFIPCSLEDWRLTVQKKYREWFYQGPQIKDDSYYDIAIEEVSEDEFELDKELEKFFET